MTKKLVIAFLFTAVNCQSGEESLFAETMSVFDDEGEK
jgi:hypothetical protein